MSKETSLLNRSFQILHSFCLAFTVAFFLEPQILSSYLITSPDSAVFQSIGWLILTALLPIQIYFYSGIYGSLLQMVSGESVLINLRKFHTNARQLWPVYLPIFFLPYLIHFISFLFSQNLSLPLNFYKTHFDILIIFITVILFIHKKYNLPIKLHKEKISLKDSVVLGFILVLNLVVLYIPVAFPIPIQDFDRVILFFTKYLHFLSFVIVAQLIIKNHPETTGRFQSMRELILINPGGTGILSGLTMLLNRAYPPVFLVLKALTPATYKLSEFSRVRWHKHYYQTDKLVAITCYTSNAAEAYKMAKEYKRLGSTVIMGGPHVTYLPDEALQFCDSVVIGEAEGIWPKIIEDYERHELKPKYVGQAIKEYHEIVHQALLNSPPEIIKDFLETTRGCKFHCSFCSIPGLSGGNVRNKPPLEIVQLINKIKHRYPSVTFLDNNIYSDPVYAKQLFEALKPLKIKWSSFCTIDIAKNEKLLKLAKESGCELLNIGYEIKNDSLESSQGGKFAMADKYFEYTQKIKKAGINIRAGFIFGFESDKYRNFIDVWKFCFRK